MDDVSSESIEGWLDFGLCIRHAGSESIPLVEHLRITVLDSDADIVWVVTFVGES